MKTCIPLLCLLSACAADPKVAAELAALRQEVAALKDQKPGAAPRPSTFPYAPLGDVMGGVGGTTPNVNDLYWVLAKISVDGEERLVLAQYKALPSGSSTFRLNGVRMISADLQILEFAQDKPHLKEILNELQKKR